MNNSAVEQLIQLRLLVADVLNTLEFRLSDVLDSDRHVISYKTARSLRDLEEFIRYNP